MKIYKYTTFLLIFILLCITPYPQATYLKSDASLFDAEDFSSRTKQLFMLLPSTGVSSYSYMMTAGIKTIRITRLYYAYNYEGSLAVYGCTKRPGKESLDLLDPHTDFGWNNITVSQKLLDMPGTDIQNAYTSGKTYVDYTVDVSDWDIISIMTPNMSGSVCAYFTVTVLE